MRETAMLGVAVLCWLAYRAVGSLFDVVLFVGIAAFAAFAARRIVAKLDRMIGLAHNPEESTAFTVIVAAWLIGLLYLAVVTVQAIAG